MPRLNLNSIVSWIDSHIINYPTAMNFKILVSINMISFFLLVIISPFLGIYWLIVSSIYFLYHKKYKNIGIVWGFLFLSWYIVFTACMFSFDEPIKVGSDFLGCGTKSEETVRILYYVYDTYLFSPSGYTFFNDIFGGLCIQTLFILGILSRKFGCTIYIPSLFKGLFFLFKFIFGGKGGKGPAECCPKNKPEKSSSCNGDFERPSPNPSPKSVVGFIKSFFGKGKEPSITPEDACNLMRKSTQDKIGFFGIHASTSCVAKGKKVTYTEIGSFFDRYSVCSARAAKKNEIMEANILKNALKKKP